ncbi:lipase, partial [Helicobacter japonicus]
MKDFLYELGYHHGKDSDCVADNIISLKQKYNSINITRLQDSDIQSLTKDSPIHLLRALYTCKPFAICKENDESFLNEKNAGKILGYKSDFANIFIFNKSSIPDEYLEARKSLYKSISQLKQEKQKQELQELQKQQ